MRFKYRNLVLGGGTYAYLAFAVGSQSAPLSVMLLVYAAACMAIMWNWVESTEKRRVSKTIEFSQENALEQLGMPWASFYHVFHSSEPVLEKFKIALSTALGTKLGYSWLEDISLKDVDRDLPEPDTRVFQKSTGPKTSRGAGFLFVCTFSRNKDVQGVRWWILVTGQRDPNKLFLRLAISPVLVPFVALSYFRRQFDPCTGLMSVHPGFFEAVDLLSRTREVQFVAFEQLVETLESFGVDTSDLKQQKGNILNINVTGGQTSFGSVVQGAFNKVSAAVAGGRRQ